MRVSVGKMPYNRAGGRAGQGRRARSKCGQRPGPAAVMDGAGLAPREGDLWGQGAALSIWAGEVRGNQYFR